MEASKTEEAIVIFGYLSRTHLPIKKGRVAHPTATFITVIIPSFGEGRQWSVVDIIDDCPPRVFLERA